MDSIASTSGDEDPCMRIGGDIHTILGLRLAALFAILGTSSIGIALPYFLNVNRWAKPLFVIKVRYSSSFLLFHSRAVSIALSWSLQISFATTRKIKGCPIRVVTKLPLSQIFASRGEECMGLKELSSIPAVSDSIPAVSDFLLTFHSGLFVPGICSRNRASNWVRPRVARCNRCAFQPLPRILIQLPLGHHFCRSCCSSHLRPRVWAPKNHS